MKRSIVIAGISVVSVVGGFAAWQYLKPADPDTMMQATVRDVPQDLSDDINTTDDIPPAAFAGRDDAGDDGDAGEVIDTDEEDLAAIDPAIFDQSEQGDQVGDDPDTVEADVDASADNLFVLDIDTSRVTRAGTKVGNAKHTGEITIKTDDLEVTQDERGDISVTGSVTLDMDTIRATDGAGAGLDNHLKERFDTATYPTAVFEVDGYDASAQTVTGRLTMHGQTKAITIPNVIVTSTESAINVKTSVAIDRTLWGVTGGTPAVNKFMTIGLDLAFEAS